MIPRIVHASSPIDYYRQKCTAILLMMQMKRTSQDTDSENTLLAKVQEKLAVHIHTSFSPMATPNSPPRGSVKLLPYNDFGKYHNTHSVIATAIGIVACTSRVTLTTVFLQS
jgi:hypothetical protein